MCPDGFICISAILNLIYFTLSLQVWGGKPTGEKKEMVNGELKPQDEVASGFTNESTQNCVNGDLKHTANGGITEKTVDDPNSAKVVASEKKAVPNGVANAC